MKIVVVDNLTETFEGSLVKSGLQKSSKLDARAFAALGYDTTYVYCGHIDDTYKYKHIVANELGSKDRSLKESGGQKVSAHHLKRYLKSIKHILQSADYIIAHCHSVGMISGINELVYDKKILYVIHDVIDLMWALGTSGAVKKLRESGRNYTYVACNSDYSVKRLDAIAERAYNDYGKTKPTLVPYSGSECFDGYIDRFVWSDQTPSIDEIVNVESRSAVIGRYTPNKFHHKLYGYKNDNNTIVHYGIKDPRNDNGLKYYNRLIKEANAYQEGLSDDELWNAIKTSQSIILPCHHEGFGFTAFEAGIYGCVPVIFTKELKANAKHIHATSEYLTRAGVKHFTADISNNEEIYKSINSSLNISKDERIEISKRLLDYFSLENYVQNRIDLLNKAKKSQNSVTLFDL